MAHELDILSTGALAYVGRRPAWHQGGLVFDRPITPAEALSTIEANHKVATVPIYVQHVKDVRTGEVAYDEATQALWEKEERDTVAEFHEVEDSRATMRMDRGVPLGTVGSRYTPLQNKDAFGVLTPLVEEGLAQIETAGVLRGGRDVWMMVRYTIDSDEVRALWQKEHVLPYALITNNHSGRRQVRLMETPVNVVCANTERAAMSAFGREKAAGRAFEMRHTLNVEAKTVEAAQRMFGDLTARYDALARQYELLRRTHLDTALFRKLVLEVAAPMPKRLERAGLKAREETSRQQVLDVQAGITRLWTKGTGHSGDMSALEAMKAVSESVDHDAKLWRVRGGDEGKIAALFDGRLGAVKQDVTDSLIAYAVSAPETEAWRATLPTFNA